MSADPHDAVPMIGEAPAFVAMLEHVSRAAALNRPVLVMGERGTGKELVASRLHFLSARWDKPLVKINCAALTETLLDTELFGHEAGAFTGATHTHVGHFESAADGTLILDELGTVSARMQEKILRVIEYREFRRVGGSKTLTTDARVIGVTNEDLPAMASRGEFRADLLDRLAFDVVHVPPLRARPEDILALAFHFGVSIAIELRHAYFPGFTPSARATLLGHTWPGNVRELKNAIERSVYRSDDPDAALDAILFDPFTAPFADEVAKPPAVTQAEGEADAVGPARTFPLDFKAAVSDLERELLNEALLRTQHNQREAAELLRLTYHQLRGLVRKHPETLNNR